jgi:hypothetical protein
MSVYKEIGCLVRQIQGRSKQVFPDAFDFGVPIKSLDEPILKDVKSLAIDYYGLKVETKVYRTGATQTIQFNGDWASVIEAGFEKATIIYTTVRNNKDMIGILSVETETSPQARAQANSYNR